MQVFKKLIFKLLKIKFFFETNTRKMIQKLYFRAQKISSIFVNKIINIIQLFWFKSLDIIHLFKIHFEAVYIKKHLNILYRHENVFLTKLIKNISKFDLIKYPNYI